ncbi:hypothetical protein [Streptomyces sp. H27-D2]|uniref:hypothetical protein n=1 Tax=Streptomyces sp. H27-D2 TaxID=3046304 RepID=UPI002DB66684|nr:hypothetical protein [Streptomyces sp. H27-D2]MEC4017772.1 hypothetical protein [Streptomyces sp. H27-D2]
MSAQEDPAAPEYAPEGGETVRDAGSGRVGVVMGKVGPYYQLRPVGGGKEWDVPPSNIRAISQTEVLSVRVAVANERSRQGSRI